MHRKGERSQTREQREEAHPLFYAWKKVQEIWGGSRPVRFPAVVGTEKYQVLAKISGFKTTNSLRARARFECRSSYLHRPIPSGEIPFLERKPGMYKRASLRCCTFHPLSCQRKGATAKQSLLHPSWCVCKRDLPQGKAEHWNSTHMLRWGEEGGMFDTSCPYM